MGFFKRLLIKKALAKKSSEQDLNSIADAVLKDAMLEMQRTGKAADKILKAKILRQESAHTLAKIRELDDEFEEEEAEPAASTQDQLADKLLMSFLGGGLKPQTSKQPLENIIGYDEKGMPMVSAEAVVQNTAPNVKPVQQAQPTLNSIAGKLDPADLEFLKKEFMK